MKNNDQFRVLAVLRPRGNSDLDGGSSTVDRRLVKAASCGEETMRKKGTKKGGAK